MRNRPPAVPLSRSPNSPAFDLLHSTPRFPTNEIRLRISLRELLQNRDGFLCVGAEPSEPFACEYAHPCVAVFEQGKQWRDGANPQLPKVGERFLGTVVKTTAFGAFISLLPGRDGLVHISKLGRGKRIAKVEDVVKVGDKLQVEITEIDARGKISLQPVTADAAAAN